MTVWLTPYNRFSQSARALSEQTGYRRAVTGRAVRRTDTIVNWGSSQVPFDTRSCTIINDYGRVAHATNKLHCFQALGDEVRTVPWTTDKRVALGWGPDHHMVARTVLTGHSGNGIMIYSCDNDESEIEDAPLYTQYVKKEAEYRVHVSFGSVIDIQRKIRDPLREPVDWKVRNHQNGFIYVRGGINPPSDVGAQSCRALEVLGLQFGAVDVIVKKDQSVWFLEVNTAPGLEGQTVENYARAFHESIGR